MYVVIALQDLVLKYIVENFENVESLNGFPELLGEIIFKALVNYDQITNQNIGRHLKVFSEAYGDIMLKSLNLENQLVILNEHLDHLQPLLMHLTALDLSHCQLGSKHDMIDCIAQMTGLKTLHLSDCGVDDDVIRIITIPCRMYSKGIFNLKELDLSNNSKLTPNCLSRLRCLRYLNHLRFPAGTSVDKKNILSCMSNCGFYEEKSSYPLSLITTQGWSLPVIEKWLSPRPVAVIQKKIHSFYSNQRQRNFTIPRVQVKSSNFICLVRKDQQGSIKTTVEPLEKKFKSNDEDIMTQYMKTPITKTVINRNYKVTNTILDQL